jgi:hypothetical protein
MPSKATPSTLKNFMFSHLSPVQSNLAPNQGIPPPPPVAAKFLTLFSFPSSIHHITHPSPKKSSTKSKSTAVIPKPKRLPLLPFSSSLSPHYSIAELYHRKRPDKETENMILNFRKNEMKLASMVGSIT